MGQTHFVLVDPFHPYAQPVIESVARRLGYAPLCLHTGGRRGLRRGLRDYPWLRTAEHLVVEPGRLEACARGLASERRVAGAIPLTEATLPQTLEVLRGLGAAWNQPAVVALLRDKFALKQRLREVDPGLEVGASLRWPAGGRPLRIDDLPERAVIKPNSGYGNTSVGYFNRRTPQAELDAFVAARPGTELVIEEFHPGPEYFVNGQTGGDGSVLVLAIFRYQRVWANRRCVDWLTHQVPHSAPEFAILAEYAARTLAALGLRRSPFHLEARLTSSGPRLVEVGARLAGNGNAFICNRLHGGRLDVFGLAAEQYLLEGKEAAAAPDWRAYDAQVTTYVHGVEEHQSIIHSIDGVAELEQHPRFAGWVRKPVVGERLWPTVDLFSSPWCFLLQTTPGEDLEEAAAALRALLQLNRRSPLWRRPLLRAADLARRALGRASGLLP